MEIRSIILGFLSLRDMSGYDIKQYFTHKVGLIYDASYGAIYPTLRKLEQEELVSKKEVVQIGKPNKILYSITAKGKEFFLREMLTPLEPPVLRSDSLVRVFFASQLPQEERVELLTQIITFKKSMLTSLQKAFESLEEVDPYQQMCWEYTFSQVKHTIAFFEDKHQFMAEELLANLATSK